ncbi:MAG: DUF3499 domain-containing protein [Actinomycetales bacterium]|nr:DUF3499 domain-containing protein [Actinomycetales bacterium]
MGLTRQCSKTGCRRPSVATLTYVYADQTAVLGPLATYAEPHTYDLCAGHAERLTAPRGWEVVRLTFDATPPPPTTDDLAALADAVREAGRTRRGQSVAAAAGAASAATASAGTASAGTASAGTASAAAALAFESASGDTSGRRGHLRVLRGT